MRSFLVLLFLVAVSCATMGQTPSVLLNEGWQYLEQPIDRIEMLPAIGWTTVNLPHTWNAFDAVDQVPGYRRSASWYRKVLSIPLLPGDARYLLAFEGVNMRCRVYVNGRDVGGHDGGYIGFEVDITPAVRRGVQNEISVRADNSIDRELIPSQKSDFFLYGGITRDVWLKTVPASYIRRVHVLTPRVRASDAATQVVVAVQKAGAGGAAATVEAVLVDPEGREVTRRAVAATLRQGEQEIRLDLPLVQQPSLWSPDRPSLYTVRVSLGGKQLVSHTVTERFGYRWYEFKEHGPFLLNGNRVLLRGTHRHEDFAGMGNAMPDSLHRRDMQMIKDMGGNFVRLAHYPQDPEVYRACDELGIIVWDELPWCRGGVGDAAWKANARRLLLEMIDQNRNHPSIVFWSLGNELYWLPDYPRGGDIDSLRSFFAELKVLATKADPSRMTASRKFNGGEDIPDVFSPSIWMGWYSGNYSNYEKAITEARDKYAHLVHVEYGGDSHVGRHTENPVSGDGGTSSDGWDSGFKKTLVKNIAQQGDWSETYIVDLFDWHLHVSERLDWFAGNAQWAFKDFGTPLRPENPIPYINQKGVVDRAGNPKDAYYVFKSHWTTSPKFCYIQSHTWTERSGPSGLARPVRVYSNCSEVELFLDGRSLGAKQRNPTVFPAFGLVWEVPFTEGEHTLRALGRELGAAVAGDTTSLRYRLRRHGEAVRVELTSARMSNGNILVTATAEDKDGLPCLTYARRIYFVQEGSGHLLVDYGTPTRSAVIEMANGRAQIEFSPVPGGRAVIEARNQDFKGEYLNLRED